MASRPALVLDDPSVSSEEVKVFAGFPGRWSAGEPVAVAELGFDSDDDAYALVEELGLPLSSTTVAAGDGYLKLPDNHALNDEQLRAALATGDEVLLEGAPVEDAEPEETLDRNARDVVSAVAEIGDVDELDALERSEQAGKARSSVLQAIVDRRDALAASQGADA